MKCETSFRVIPYFLSQYLFFIVIMLSFALSNQSTSTHIAEERHCSSSDGRYWSDNYDPDYFYHMTDVHITHYIQSTLDNFEKSLQVGASFKSKSVLITGDLVDNYYLPFYPSQIQETKQILEDWIQYSEMAKKYSQNFERIIESFGNHDVPRIFSKDSDDFYYSKYSMIAKWHNNFTLPNDTYDIFTENIGNFTFLVLNPIFFPIPPLPFNYYIHAPTEYIKKVEDVLNNIPIDRNVILSTHYQGPVWSQWYIPLTISTSTNRFFSTILQNKKVKMLLTGHNHGANRMVMHYGDSFEVCASDLRYNSKSGLVTNDNGNIIYHWFSIDKPTYSFVTFPAPIDQTTSRTECSIQKVRVITFLKNSENQTFVEIDGKTLKLQPVRKLANNNDAWLLEADTSFLTNGRHHLKLVGEEEEEFEFLIGPSSKIESTKELLYDDMLWAHLQWIGLIILIVVFLCVTFPIPSNKYLSFDGYWRWINKSDNFSHHNSLNKNTSTVSKDVIYWLFSVFLGFIGIRSRVMKLPEKLRIGLFISVLVSLFLPVFTFDVEGHFGFMFIFGYFLGDGSGKYNPYNGFGGYLSHVFGIFEMRYEEWCPFLGFFYFAVAVVPVILFASSLGMKPMNEKESWLQIVDLVVLIGSLAGGFAICFDAFLLLCERKCALLSPFILFPFSWMIVFAVFFFIRKKERNDESSYQSNYSLRNLSSGRLISN